MILYERHLVVYTKLKLISTLNEKREFRKNIQNHFVSFKSDLFLSSLLTICLWNITTSLYADVVWDTAHTSIILVGIHRVCPKNATNYSKNTHLVNMAYNQLSFNVKITFLRCYFLHPEQNRILSMNTTTSESK